MGLIFKPTIRQEIKIEKTKLNKATQLEGVFATIGGKHQGANCAMDTCFEELTTVLKPENSKLFSSVGEKNIHGEKSTTFITFGTNNEKKLNYMQAVFDGLNLIPEKIVTLERDVAVEKDIIFENGVTFTTVGYLNSLTAAFTKPNYNEYVQDLKRACEYLIRDGATNQGGKAFTRFIKSILHVFTAIEELIKLRIRIGSHFPTADVAEGSVSKTKLQLDTICDKFKQGLGNVNTSGSKYGFAGAATGAVIGGGLGFGATTYSGASYFIATLTKLKSTLIGIASKLGIALAPAVAAVITSPITAGALGLGGIGAGVVKGVQYLRDNAAQKRLKGDYKRTTVEESVLDV